MRLFFLFWYHVIFLDTVPTHLFSLLIFLHLFVLCLKIPSIWWALLWSYHLCRGTYKQFSVYYIFGSHLGLHLGLKPTILNSSIYVVNIIYMVSPSHITITFSDANKPPSPIHSWGTWMTNYSNTLILTIFFFFFRINFPLFSKMPTDCLS